MIRLSTTLRQFGAAARSARAPSAFAYAQPSIEDRVLALFRRLFA